MTSPCMYDITVHVWHHERGQILYACSYFSVFSKGFWFLFRNRRRNQANTKCSSNGLNAHPSNVKDHNLSKERSPTRSRGTKCVCNFYLLQNIQMIRMMWIICTDKRKKSGSSFHSFVFDYLVQALRWSLLFRLFGFEDERVHKG